MADTGNKSGNESGSRSGRQSGEETGDLRGLTVLVTRPAGQGESLVAAIRAMGARAVHFPLLVIEPVADPSRQAVITQQIQELDNYHVLIFVSTNAARFGLAWIDRFWPQFPAGVEVLAVGPATAAALQQLPCEVQVSPAGMQSEDILALPLLNRVDDRKIALFRGVGGRELLAETLRRRGARVDYIETYERRPPGDSSAQLHSLIRSESINVITVTSAQILDTFCGLVDIKRNGLNLLPLLVPSERVREKALDAGFIQVISCAGATDEAIIAALGDVAWQVRNSR